MNNIGLVVYINNFLNKKENHQNKFLEKKYSIELHTILISTILNKS